MRAMRPTSSVSRRGVDRHEGLLVSDHQIHESSLPHDDLLCIGPTGVEEGIVDAALSVEWCGEE